MLNCFVVSIVHQTLTWSTGSLTCVCDLFACVYTWGTSVYNNSLIRRTFVESVQNFDSREIWGRAQSLAHKLTLTHPFGDHARSCLILAFESECSCSMPLTSHSPRNEVGIFTHTGAVLGNISYQACRYNISYRCLHRFVSGCYTHRSLRNTSTALTRPRHCTYWGSTAAATCTIDIPGNITQTSLLAVSYNHYGLMHLLAIILSLFTQSVYAPRHQHPYHQHNLHTSQRHFVWSCDLNWYHMTFFFVVCFTTHRSILPDKKLYLTITQ